MRDRARRCPGPFPVPSTPRPGSPGGRRRARSGAGAAFLLLALASPGARAEEAAAPGAPPDPVFRLGTVLVTAKAPEAGEVASEQAASVLTSKEIRRRDRETVAGALSVFPGVTLSTNARDERTVFVRGSDSRQVPVFVDGIPVSVAYDGTVDLVSRRPSPRFEADASVGLGEGSGRHAGRNAGSDRGSWFFQLGAARREAESFRLSSAFVATPLEDGGTRDDSGFRDTKLSLKLGLTPARGDEHALTFVRQDGEKGPPPSTAPPARNGRWPEWDESSLCFVSRTAVGARETVRTRLLASMEDRLWSVSGEDTVSLSAPTQLSVGLAHPVLSPREVYRSSGAPYSVPPEARATDSPAGLSHDAGGSPRLSATFAARTRLPTLKDRYSQRPGLYVENPDLGPERSFTWEAGYQGSPWRGARAEAALFRSDTVDRIQSVNLSGAPSCTTSTPCQMQNVGETRARGLELDDGFPAPGRTGFANLRYELR